MRLPLRILWGAIALTVVLIACALAVPVFGATSPQLSDEIVKILLQFLLATVAGAALLAFLGWRQGERQILQASIEKLQDLDDEISEAYRQMKSCKRRIRSCRLAPPPAALEVPKDDFERLMEQLLEAQLAMEEVQDSISTRRHLLGEEDRSAIERLLHYPARYLHDVYEDFEMGRVTRGAGGYVGAAARNLRDFVDPENLPKPIEQDFACFARKDLPLTERLDALDRVRATERRIASEESQSQGRKVARRRFARVAYQACRAASQALKGIVDAEIARLGKF